MFAVAHPNNYLVMSLHEGIACLSSKTTQ